jgi:hypothetical protein
MGFRAWGLGLGAGRGAFPAALLLMMAAGCAMPDPLRTPDPFAPLEAGHTPELSADDAARLFSERWPERFRCVHTATLDFGVQTRTLTGYLAVERPGMFRLQGMTEHGVRLFEMVRNGENLSILSNTEEFSADVLHSVARDVSRVFLQEWPEGEPGGRASYTRTALGSDSATVQYATRFAGIDLRATGTPSRVVRYELNVASPPYPDRLMLEMRDDGFCIPGAQRCRVDHYEWREFGELLLPSVVVLRHYGKGEGDPPYKLTIQITSFETRDTPWPERLFLPPEEE